MSNSLGRLQVDLEARIAKFEQDMGRAARVLQKDMVRAAQQSERAMTQMRVQSERNMERIQQAARGATTAIVGFFSVQQGARALAGLSRVADQYSNIQAKVRLAAGEQANLSQSMDAVFQVSQRTFNTLDGTAALVQRGATALRNFGQDADQAFSNSLALAETFNKALVISGASASEASSAAMQFSQALASGRFQGDEFRSVLENNSRFAQLLADSLGVNIAQLREMSAAGKLTTTDMLGLLKRTQELDAEFDRMPTTIGRARTQLDNAFTRYIGEADQAYGVSRTFAGGLQAIARNLDPILSGVGQLAVVTAGAITARTLQGLRDYGQAVVARAQADRIAAAATAQRAQADAAANAVALTRARAEQITAEQAARSATADRLRIEQTVALANSQAAMIRANGLRATSEIQLARLSQQLTAVESARLAATQALGAARQREVALNAALAGSNRALAASMAAAGVAGAASGAKITLAMRASQAATAAMTVAARGMASALAFVGGPVGVLIIGLGLLATKLMGAKQEADALRDSAKRAAEGLAELNRESSAGQILSAGSSALSERERLRDQQAVLQKRLNDSRNMPVDPFGFIADDRKQLQQVNADLAELERQIARTAKLADEYRGAQEGATGATQGAGDAASEYAKKLEAEAEQLRMQRFELEKGLKARLLLEAMQAQGVTSVEALDEATRKHIDTIVSEKGAIDAANEARKGGVSAAREAQREAERQARDQKKLQEDMRQAAQQASSELDSILQAQGGALGGPALQAAQEYANEMTRLLGIEQALTAAGALATEQVAGLAIARQQAFELYQAQINQPTVAEQMLSDAQFELDLLRMSNAERATAIMLRGREAEFTAAQVAELDRLNAAYEREREVTQQMDQFRSTMADTFSSILDGTKSISDAFEDMAASILSQIARLIAQQWVDKLFGQQGTSGGGMFGDSVSGIFGSFFGGAFAGGGRPPVGKASVVGERGPELFVPDYSGTIIPADKTSALMSATPASPRRGGDTFIIQGATSNRALDRIQLQQGRQQRRAQSEIA